ncbi:Methionine aminopeptidase 1D, mitochondrial [Halotydeus destructor]|nr:Methionine aminopeptidase 1D, mitochondrial [Halotydeus destructor]
MMPSSTCIKFPASLSRRAVANQSSRSLSVLNHSQKQRWLSPSGFDYRVVLPRDLDKTVRIIPDSIMKPKYAFINFRKGGKFKEPLPLQAEVHGEDVIAKIAESCRLARIVLEEAGQVVRPGIDCQRLDDIVYETCIKLNCYPSPLNYKGFPKCVTTSVNNVAVHAIPDRTVLEEGDIVTVDVSVYHGGYHGDTASTFPVGEVDTDAAKLLRVSRTCLTEAIKLCRHGEKIKNLGKRIDEVAEGQGLKSIPSLCGHGIATYFHGPPQILHYNTDETEYDDDAVMVKNMVFTIEPVICEGEVDVEILEDGWTIVTADNGRCAQFEHTICITDGTARVLT